MGKRELLLSLLWSCPSAVGREILWHGCVGEEYLLEELEDERKPSTAGETYDPEVLYWIGYLYRYWACYRNESSKAIYKIAPAKTMKRNYPSFHTLDPDGAIDNLIEIREQRIGSRTS